MPVSIRTSAKSINTPLLKWYAHHGRNLPWRNTRDPYQILISEIMLQQTQVERVIPAYSRFLLTFPTIQELAIASPMQVIQAWQGLGYYRRAVRLHQLSQIITNEMCGQIPTTVDELIKLPGIGHYTAAAVSCFAFNHQVAAIDVNVSRVLHRVLGKHQPSKSSSPTKHFQSLTQHILPSGHATKWNQALMDVGSLFCKSRAPLCSACPLVRTCNHSNICEQSTHTQQTPLVQNTADASHKFHGSTRYFRGSVIRILSGLETTEHITLDKLLNNINSQVEEQLKLSVEKFLVLLQNMANDGLITQIKTQTTNELFAVKLPS